jgi:predicted ATPase
VYEDYMQLVNSNKLQYDEHQYKIVKTLERVQQGIHQSVLEESPQAMLPRGLYIYGEVGTGT